MTEPPADPIRAGLELLLAWHDAVKREFPLVPSPFGIEKARGALEARAEAEEQEESEIVDVDLGPETIALLKEADDDRKQGLTLSDEEVRGELPTFCMRCRGTITPGQETEMMPWIPRWNLSMVVHKGCEFRSDQGWTITMDSARCAWTGIAQRMKWIP